MVNANSNLDFERLCAPEIGGLWRRQGNKVGPKVDIGEENLGIV